MAAQGPITNGHERAWLELHTRWQVPAQNHIRIQELKPTSHVWAIPVIAPLCPIT